MNKWKGSTAAKVVAWILLTISAVFCVASVIAIAVMTSEGVYQDSKEEARDKVFATVANRYSLLAAYNYHHDGKDANKDVFADTSFQYGIIETDSIEDLDLNADDNYLERNFSQKVTEDDLQIYSLTLSDDTSIVYRDGFLTGCAYTNNHGDNYGDAYVSLYVDRICYDTASGILYYKTEQDEYFPVRHVQLVWQDETYYLDYDFEVGQYVQHYDADKVNVSEEVSVGESSSKTEDPATVAAEEEQGQLEEIPDGNANKQEDEAAAIKEVLEQENFNFNMLEKMGVTRLDVGNLLLGGVREIPLTVLDNIDIKGNGLHVTEARDYYLDENYTLQVNYTGEKQKQYTVVSIFPETVPEGWSKDMFVQANTVINLMYGWRYPAFVVCILSFLLALDSFLFLVSAAGHRKHTEEIVPLLMDTIWVDVVFGLFCGAEAVLWMVLLACSYELPNSPYIILFVLAGLCMGWLLLWFILSFAVRFKMGKWWRNSLIYNIMALLGRFIRMVWRNIGFLWRWILIMLILAFCEFMGIFLFQYDTEAMVLLWFLEKVVLYVLILWGLVQMKKLKDGGERIAAGELQYKIDTRHMIMDFKCHGDNINSISEGMSRAVDERMKSERFKTELITNVSHDIKTPLTSIINYVDLLEKEKLENETVKEYLEVLDRQSGRLKKLIEDLIEASKASTGNLAVHLERLEAGVFMVQTVGEFEEKTKAAELDLQIKKPEQPVYIMADGRHFWRVIDNLMNNICKYAQPGTRVYINMEAKEEKVEITFRNTSKYSLNISSEELIERFVRGDSSRNTEGSGLGLSIANSLMELMGGTFKLYVDGDLFKVVLEFEEAAMQE